MIMESRSIIANLPIKVKLRHVEGHQDDKGKVLDWWARQNILMDAKAKWYWRKTIKKPLPNQLLRYLRWTVQVRGEYVSSFQKEDIYAHVRAQPLKEYWQRKHAITDEAWETINWKASKQALKEQPRGTKRWHGKHATGHCGVGRMMKICQEWTESVCPLCGEDNETCEHVLKCKDPVSNQMIRTNPQSTINRIA